MRIQSLPGLLLCALAGCGRGGVPAADRARGASVTGDSVALYNAGAQAYRTKQFGEARVRWRLAAARGDPDAASNLGFLLYYGYCGPVDSTAGIALWQRAMRQRDAEAHRHVAQAILQGDHRLGTLSEGYSHAFAARLLARRPGELAGDAVARDAGLVVEALQPTSALEACW